MAFTIRLDTLVGTTHMAHGRSATLRMGGDYEDGFYHIGEDMLDPLNASVLAIADGTVVKIYTTNASDAFYLGPGNSVMFVKHRLVDGSYFLAAYMHVRPTVSEGATIAAGSEIAKVGPWYNSTHLHFGIHPNTTVPTTKWGRMTNPDWEATNGFVDPVDWLNNQTPYGTVTGTSPVISWTHLVDMGQPRYYRDLADLAPVHVSSFSYNLGGTDTLNVWEYLDGTYPTDQPHHNHSGWIELDRGGVGMHTYRVRATNGVGTDDKSFQMGFDNVPPTVSRTGGTAPNTWVRGSQAVQYTGADANAGFKDSHWWIEGQGDSGWAGDNPRGCPLPSADGKYRLHVEAADDAWTGSSHTGNSSGDVFLGEFWVDNTPPTVSFGAITPASGGDAGQVTIKVNADDPGGANASGLAVVVASIDGAEFTGANGTFVWDASTASEGTHTIGARVTDFAGNTATATTTYTISRTPPAATLTLSPATPNGANGWYTVQPTATLAAPSATGTSVLRYSINGGADQTYTASFGVAARGTVTIRYWAVSASGRVGPVGTRTALIDTTPPAGFTLLGDGDQTPSTGALNVSLVGTIDAESAPWGITYTVGNAPGDDRYRRSSTQTMMGPWLALDGLSLPVGARAFVTLRVTNYAGLTSAWVASDGITVNPSAWNHAVWNDVLGGAGGYMADSVGLLLGGTLGEALTDKSRTSNGDGALDAGLWSLFVAKPSLTANVTLGNYVASAVAGTQVTVELRRPGTVTAVETLTATLDASGNLSLPITSAPGTYDVALKAGHWLRRVVPNVVVSASGASAGAVSLVNGDVNGDNVVSAGDLAKVKIALGTSLGDPGFNPDADLNGDGVVSAADLSIVKIRLGTVGDD